MLPLGPKLQLNAVPCTVRDEALLLIKRRRNDDDNNKMLLPTVSSSLSTIQRIASAARSFLQEATTLLRRRMPIATANNKMPMADRSSSWMPIAPSSTTDADHSRELVAPLHRTVNSKELY